MRGGVIQPGKLLNQLEPMSEVIQACEAFDRREPEWLKVVLGPSS